MKAVERVKHRLQMKPANPEGAVVAPVGEEEEVSRVNSSDVVKAHRRSLHGRVTLSIMSGVLLTAIVLLLTDAVFVREHLRVVYLNDTGGTWIQNSRTLSIGSDDTPGQEALNEIAARLSNVERVQRSPQGVIHSVQSARYASFGSEWITVNSWIAREDQLEQGALIHDAEYESLLFKQIGWPFRAVEFRFVDGRSSRYDATAIASGMMCMIAHEDELDDLDGLLGDVRSASADSWTVIWLGVIANVGVFAAASFLVVIGAVGMARQRRRRRGRCPLCRYDLRGCLRAGCPECGWDRAESRR